MFEATREIGRVFASARIARFGYFFYSLVKSARFIGPAKPYVDRRNSHSVLVCRMAKARFEWDQARTGKTKKSTGWLSRWRNSLLPIQARHRRKTSTHSSTEKRHYCFGWVGGAILRIRFTYRDDVIRIYGAGYWRKGKQIYERENPIHGRTPRRPRGRS